MNHIIGLNEIDRTITVESGVVTETLQEFVKSKDLFYPVDFAARGSSQIGGNIATNAGGIKVVRYGMTRDWVLGLKVVTGSGEVLELNQGLIKNATGYDLRHLFVGSEGTLGIIVEATMKLTTIPDPSRVFLLACSDLSGVMGAFQNFSKTGNLVAFEMFSDQALSYFMQHSGFSAPLGTRSPFYVVMEVSEGSEIQSDLNMKAFEACLESGFVSDGTFASNENQARTLWRYREGISESLAPFSPYKNDISVRPSQVPLFVDELEKILRQKYPSWNVVWFGHIGDGNLHINILRPEKMTKEEFVSECQKVDPLVFGVVKKFSGSISAEHGVGLSKKKFLEFSRSPVEIALMKQIKKVFDPDLVMNPGKIFD